MNSHGIASRIAPRAWLPLLVLVGSMPFIRASDAASGADVEAVVNQSRAAKSGDDFLPPERVFIFSASADGAQRVRLSWLIAPGYYLYRDRIKASSDAAPDAVGAPDFPAGQTKSDEYFGQQVVYHNRLVVMLPVRHASCRDLALALSVTYQGCAEAGLCYPPVTRTVSVLLPGASGGGLVLGSGV